MKTKILGFVPSITSALLIMVVAPIAFVIFLCMLSLILFGAIAAPILVLLGERIKVTTDEKGKKSYSFSKGQ